MKLAEALSSFHSLLTGKKLCISPTGSAGQLHHFSDIELARITLQYTSILRKPASYLLGASVLTAFKEASPAGGLRMAIRWASAHKLSS